MTWNSSCSIASDDENSMQSFLSDFGSEFDLQPQPRYPAAKRTYSTSNKQLLNRTEPPLTRSRAKAIGQAMIMPEPLPKQRRRSTLRRSIDALIGMNTTLTNNFNNNNSILFPKQESSNDRVFSWPTDGVNVLADKFESCSLDEGKLNKNCIWPSRETNSHYIRPITSPSTSNPFVATNFSTFNTSPLFGEQQALLWSRFRFAASNLRNNLWVSQTDINFQENSVNDNYHFRFNPQTMPMKSASLENQVQESTSPFLRDHKTSVKQEMIKHRSSLSKFCFTITIFLIGLIFGYLLTNTFPPGLVWDLCIKYFHLFCVHFQDMLKYLA